MFNIYMVKYFSILLGSIYAYFHIVNEKQTHKLFFVLLAVFLSPIAYMVRTLFPVFTIPVMTILIFLILIHTSNQKISTILCMTIISIAINFVLYDICLILFIPITYPLTSLLYASPYSDWIKTFLISTNSLGQLLLLKCIFLHKRMKNGFPGISNGHIEYFSFVSSIIVLIISTIIYHQDNQAFLILSFLLFFTLALGLLLYVWWRHNITTTYLQKVKEREIAIAEHTIEKQKLEIEKLSKIIHKDNKLLSALELSVRSLCDNPSPSHKDRLLKELNFLSKERHDTLNHYEGTSISLPKTNVFSLDMIIDYLQKKSLDEDIYFDVALLGNISFFVSDIADEHDLDTLLSDLGENAIHAVSGVENRRILLSIGVKDKVYFLSIHDSGSAFSPKVIENLGQKRYTTRKSDGGSGIGLMTTIELLKKYKASFELEEFNENASYTKSISLVWDKKNEIRIKGPNVKQYKANSIRKDIVFSNS